MWYVEVLVADATYHKEDPLTYASQTRLEVGSVVVIPLRKKRVLGIVSASVKKPPFKSKEVLETPNLPALPKSLLELLSWLRRYYPAPSGLTTQMLLPSSLPKKPVEINPLGSLKNKNDNPPLTKDQSSAIKKLNSPGLHLLHGETGTGKTRVYIELAKKALKEGASCIILTPEIGLTSQLSGAFKADFGDRVVIMHSGLSEVARSRNWQWLLQQSEPVVVIGARSALFSPLKKVGLIVLDEEHEPAYKQDQAPYYHATTVAAKLASIHQAILVLGSATPLVSDYYIAEAKKRPIIRMTQLATASASNELDLAIIDLKDRSLFSKSSHLSDLLLEAMRERLEKKEQVMLFLNRRGTARIVFCDNCGWHALCPNCDLPIVYHGDYHEMRCHSCSYRDKIPGSCPSCQNLNIVFKSIGTKAIHEEVRRLFPEANSMRFDADNKKSERLEANYDDVRSGKVDVIVGTQTLAKGLDLPKLGLVGVVLADTSLYFPDFSAEERTYQLLSQVLGRIGRGHRNSSAIIQTYSPRSSLLESILTKNWSSFYNKELEERRKFLFPPFCYILKLSCSRASSANAEKAANNLVTKLRSLSYNIEINGPVPAFHEKTNTKFVWQLIIKSKRREYLTNIIKQLPSSWSYDIDPLNLL